MEASTYVFWGFFSSKAGGSAFPDVVGDNNGAAARSMTDVEIRQLRCDKEVVSQGRMGGLFGWEDAEHVFKVNLVEEKL